MFKIILGLLSAALEAWNHHEKNKYVDEARELDRKYDEEFNKPSYEDRENYPDLRPSQFRDNNALDRYERELLKLSETYLALKNQ